MLSFFVSSPRDIVCPTFTLRAPHTPNCSKNLPLRQSTSIQTHHKYLYLWICDGSGNEVALSEVTSIIKRLKVKTSKGQDGPILVIVYPALVSDPSSGLPRVSPILLTHHHCNPPPEAENAAVWLPDLRKFHAKHFSKMQRDRFEEKMTAMLKGRMRINVWRPKRRRSTGA